MSHFNNETSRTADVSSSMELRRTASKQMERLRDELRARRHPTDQALLDKLERCGVDWQDGRYRCHSPACVRCRWQNRNVQQRETINWLGDFKNEDLAFVSVVLAGTTDINNVGHLITKSRQDTVNRFKAARRRDKRWTNTHLRAWHEVDAVGAQHIYHLPPQRGVLIPQIAPIDLDGGSATWLPTWHGLMFLNGLPFEDVASELGRQWKLAHQVDVKPLNEEKSVTDNLANLASYANKFHCSVSLQDGLADPWPLRWQTEFFGWLSNDVRNPFERLRMTVHQGPEYKNHSNRNVVVPTLPMPFIHKITSVPMYYNTGAWR